MMHLLISLIVFGCVFGSAVIGLSLHKWLPEHHFSEESINAIKLATGLIATIAALVLGLLISSAKGSFDTVNSDLVRNAVSIIRLDRALEQYGPQTQDLRVLLKHSYSAWIDLLGSNDSAKLAKLDSPSAVGQIEVFERKLAQLSPSTPAQAQLQTRALQISDDVFAARWLALLQKRGSIPMPLLVVLIFWLSIIFGTFGLFAPHNGTVIFFFILCALSASGAIFLILEMDTPLDGIIKISVAPMREALQQLGP
jgi:hypothetical protein